MDETLRLFIAIDLPAEVKALLHEMQQQLRQHTSAVRWADPHGTHLTLKFLGATRAAAVPAITEGVQHAAARNRRFELQTGDLGVFPNMKRPRVVWLGIAGDVAELRQVQADVERFVAPLGFPSEHRPFSPHLTLGRSGKEPRPADLQSIAEAVQRVAIPRRLAFKVDELVLMRSEPGPGGARYTPIAHVGLDADS